MLPQFCNNLCGVKWPSVALRDGLEIDTDAARVE